MRLLPPTTVPTHAVTISVNLPDDKPASASRCGDAARRLLPVFASFGVQATWGVTDVSGQLAMEILSVDSRHQVDLLIDGQQICQTAGRRLFRRQLEDAVQSAERAGHDVTTAVARNADAVPHQDLLIKHGISLLASDRRLATGDGPLVTLRYGLWEIPAAISLPLAGARTAGHRTRRLLDRRISRGEVLHLAIDGAAVAATKPTIRGLERLLQHIQLRRSQQRLQVFTTNEIARRVQGQRRTPAACSILRIDAQQKRAA